MMMTWLMPATILHAAIASGAPALSAQVEHGGLGSRSLTVSCSQDGSDSTELLVAAFNKSDAAVTLAANHTCISEPLELTAVRNITITLEHGAELQAKRGSNQFGVLLRLESAVDITIQGGSSLTSNYAYSAVSRGTGEEYGPSAAELARPMIRMWREDYANASLYAHSEHRHALSLHSCSMVILRQLRLAYSGGDGIYVESVRNSVFSSLTVDHNFRQGMSVIEADGLVVKDSIFASTRGTAPMAGIDFEPNEARNAIRRVQLTNCRIVQNAGAGVQFALHAYTDKTPPMGVQFNNTLIVSPLSVCYPGAPGCYTTKPYYRWGILIEANSKSLPHGNIRMTGTRVLDNGHWSSPPVWVEKSAGLAAPLMVDFDGLTVNTSRGAPAITVSATGSGGVSGGVRMADVVVNRQCCPHGGPFMTAESAEKNELVDVSVLGSTVYVNSTDDAQAAAIECNVTLSPNAARNRVLVSHVACER